MVGNLANPTAPAGRRGSRSHSRIMAAVRSKDTTPELMLRRGLFAEGLRYRVGFRSAIGRPDVAFPRVHLAVFVDGDFWHGNEWRRRVADPTRTCSRVGGIASSGSTRSTQTCSVIGRLKRRCAMLLDGASILGERYSSRCASVR